MKKTYNISLNGHLFHMEEDAGNKLQNYIQTLEDYYLKEDDGREIMNDIEGRIAELLEEYMQTPDKKVITITDIEKVISVMGTPNDIIDDSGTPHKQQKQEKKLYRDTDHMVFGGVASGIAAYLNVSIVAVRLIFALLAFFYGVTILIYIVLWIAVPAALTAKQKLEMKGEPINISNIEKNIRNNISEIKNGKLQNFFQKPISFIADILRALFRVIGKIGGVLLKIIAAFILIFSALATATLIVSFFSLHYTPFNLHFFGLSVVMDTASSIFMEIAILLIVLCPLFLLIWLSSRFLFDIKKKNLFVPLGLLALWVTGIAIAIVAGIALAGKFSEKNQEISATPIELTPNKCLVIIANPQQTPWENSSNLWDINCRKSTDGNDLYISPRIEFKISAAQKPEVILTKKAHGSSVTNALQNAQAEEFNWTFKNDTLWIDNYFKINKPWRKQELNMTIQLPENQKIYLDPSLDQRWKHNYQYDFFDTDTYYLLEQDGLKQVDK